MKKQNIILSALKNSAEYEAFSKETAATKDKAPSLVTGLSQGSKEAFSALSVLENFEKTKKPSLLIIPEEREITRLCDAMEAFGIRCAHFPLRDFGFYNITASHDYEHERLRVLSALSADAFSEPYLVVATSDAALGYTMPKEVLKKNSFTLEFGQTVEIEELLTKLILAGYTREDMVNGVGQFSRRGYIVDIYSPSCKNPYRIEFFDNEIDQISIFDVMTQRRIENVKEITVTPAREVLQDQNCKRELCEHIRKLAKKAKDAESVARLHSEAESLECGIDVNFQDKYISFIYPQKASLLDYFDKDCYIQINEYKACTERAEGYEWQLSETVESLLQKGEIDGKYADFAKTKSDLDAFLQDRACVICEAFTNGAYSGKLSGIFPFSCRYIPAIGQNYELLFSDLSAYMNSKSRILILCETETAAKTLQKLMFDNHIPSETRKNTEFGYESMMPGVPILTYGTNLCGFELTKQHFVCISLFDVSAALGGIVQKRNRARRKKDVKTQILSYSDLNVGDYVVHRAHGIGRYEGIKNIVDIFGNSRDYIKISYAGSDTLFIPCDQLDAISKYIGAAAENGRLKLSKMGGAEWKRTTEKVKSAAHAMAKELIALYAERMRKEGHAFQKDDDFMREFESSFEYEETEGQLKSASEIKADMEMSAPMDRLLCGDVGFGKTEVAMRAAFKAVLGGKQVALLVPTTILAMQHHQTLLARMKAFGVRVEVMLRFQTNKAQADILKRLREGDIDILIGTHRIISEDVKFSDLGLVIIDEEQRFGVAQKEKLKQIAHNVDVLTLSATPIPRTLNMAMSGIRDMSILDEAPEDRVPVQSYVLEYDDVIITEAIRKELRRGGQVFYLHNNVETIYAAAKRISEKIPEAKIGVAHGKLDKEELSDIWQQMVMGEIDILVSTTIIETGVDAPNANTLIIENSDRMGLSQLHQIRGRIGRSARRAYAYFTYPPQKVLSEIATKRLQAIRDYTEFGAGFKIAMRDLEIRGAGNVLGSEQHGHMESVGYDLYIKILNEAILEEKGEEVKIKTDCSVDFRCDAYIPKKYISAEAMRIETYKRIASIENTSDFDDVCDEICDRYGEMPRAVLNLVRISYIRANFSNLGILSVEQKENEVILRPERFDLKLWSEVSEKFPNMKIAANTAKPFISLRLLPAFSALDLCEKLSEELLTLQNKQ